MPTLAKAPSISRSLVPAGRRAGVVLLVLALVILGVGTSAWAYWSTTGTGTGSATNATMNDPTAPTAVAGAGGVTLTWTSVTLSSGAAVDGYRVYRHYGSSSTVACTASTPAHSCDDTSPVGATVQYGVVALKGSWTSHESPLTSFTYDAMAPTTSMSVSPAANAAGYNNTDVVVTLVATDTGSGVDKIVYTLDGSTTSLTNTGVDTPFQTQFTMSTEGQHTLSFHAVDKAGNVETDSTTSTFKIDKTKPAAPTNLAISSDTGSSSTDRVTKTTVQTVSGKAEANSKVILFKGSAQVGTTTADGAGAWSVPNVTLSEGSNNLTATATDPADNVSDSSAVLTVALDTQTPVTPTVTQSISSDTGTSSTDRLTKASSQTLKGTAEPNAIVTVTRTPSGSFSSTADGTGAWSADVALAEGSNAFAVTQTDVAGNGPSPAAAVAAIVLDTTAPTASTNPSGSSSLWRTTQSVVINALDSGSTTGVASVTWSVDAGAATTVNTSSTTAIVPDGSLRSLTYLATDLAGNVSSGATEQYKIDSVAPTTTQGTVTGTLGNNGWYTASVSFPLNVTDVTSGPGATQWSTASSSGPWTQGTAVTVSTEGTNPVYYESTDVAGNKGTGQLTVKIDKTGPSLSDIRPADGSTWTNTNPGGTWSGVCGDGSICAVVTDPVSGVDGGSISYVLTGTSGNNNGKCWDGSNFVSSGGSTCTRPMTYASSSGQAKAAAPGRNKMALGDYALTISAVDNAGNPSSTRVVFKVINP